MYCRYSPTLAGPTAEQSVMSENVSGDPAFNGSVVLSVDILDPEIIWPSPQHYVRDLETTLFTLRHGFPNEVSLMP